MSALLKMFEAFLVGGAAEFSFSNEVEYVGASERSSVDTDDGKKVG